MSSHAPSIRRQMTAAYCLLQKCEFSVSCHPSGAKNLEVAHTFFWKICPAHGLTQYIYHSSQKLFQQLCNNKKTVVL